jgi:glycerate-2-kinase
MCRRRVSGSEFSVSTLFSNRNPRGDALSIWNAGVDAVRARPLVERVVSREGDELVIENHRLCRSDFDRILVVGAGKAGAAMAQGLVAAVGDWLPLEGWVNVPQGTETELPGIRLFPARPAGVNEPTETGIRGTDAILELVSGATRRDLCIALISGGGSALLPAPAEGILLADQLAVIRHLSGAGADITELNTVRKHLSRVKGGGLLRACRCGALVTLILSDVLGDPVDLIASGPTVHDTSSPRDALDVLERFDADRTLPARVYDVLAGQVASGAGKRDPEDAAEVPATTLVIGNNAVAVDEAGIRAEHLGYNHVMHSATRCEGGADDVGGRLAEMVVRMLREQDTTHPHDCLITGGEPTVSLAPPEIRGLGGRNQQLVLAAYAKLLELEVSPDQWRRLAILSGGTDGEDGPTDAAGAVLDEAVHRRSVGLGLDVADYLRRNDAYRFFEAAGGLVVTGPTGTNVCDLRVALVGPA